MKQAVALDRLYKLVPHLECQGHCQESCGPIIATRGEVHRMERAGGPFVLIAEDLRCGYLKDGRCSVYDVRPLICRLWGVDQKMPCQWGCKPKVPLPTAEGRMMLEASKRIGGTFVAPVPVGPDGLPVPDVFAGEQR